MAEGLKSEGVVHVVDDDAAMRDSLAFLLEEAELETRLYEGPGELLARAETLEPGCILTDVRMPEMSGLDLIRKLRDQGVRHPVVVMTGHADVPLAIEAMRLGVADFIEKPFDDEQLLASLQSALQQGRAQRRRDEDRESVAARLASLSGREREVLDGLIEGKPNKTIAYDLGISARTVEVYRAHVMTKMEARSLSDLVRMALLIERDAPT
jgi:two-component system response regulator FixJ